MSALTAPANILLTGGSGFIGAAVLANLLAKGFSVHAVVRSSGKAAPFNTTFKSYIDSGKLTFVVVPDMTIPGAFSAALEGIDGVVHCASPMPPTDPNIDPEVLLGPAVQMTTGILQDAAKVSSVKRVIVTSSVVTLYEPKEGKYVYSEADWFDLAPKLVKQYGAKASSGIKYMASKVLAERAAWEWVEKNKPSFEFVTVLPPWTWGKSVVSNPEHVRPASSNFHLLSALSLAKTGELAPKDFLAPTEFCDVLDIAEGHARALTVPEAAGQRFPLRGGSITWQDAFDIVNTKPIPGVDVPEGVVGSGKTVEMERPFTDRNAKQILGMTYRPIEETVHDTIAQAVELGWSINDSEKEPVW